MRALVEEGSETRATSTTASTTCSDQTDLLARGCVTTDGGSLTKMLMVTTTMRMVHRVHGNTLHVRPSTTLCLVLPVGVTGLKQRLLGTSTTGDDTNHGTAGRAEGLLGTRGQLHASLALIGVVADDGGVVAASTSKVSTVTGLLLNVADDGTFRHLTDGENVADGQSSTLAAVDELAGVETLRGDEEAADSAEAVGVTELDASERSTTSGIVDDLTDNTLHVTVTLSIINGAELCRTLPVGGVSLEDTTSTTTAATNDLTHTVDGEKYTKKKNQTNKKEGQKKKQIRIFFLPSENT